jgi:hypothetical protein
MPPSLRGQVDPWCEGIWGPLKAALAGAAEPAPPAKDAAAPAVADAAPAPAPAPAPAAAKPAAAAPAGLVDGLAPEGVDLAGAPALAPPRVAVEFGLPPAEAAAVRGREAAAPSAEERARRDAGGAGAYSAAAPFWARVAGARCGPGRLGEGARVSGRRACGPPGLAFGRALAIDPPSRPGPHLAPGQRSSPLPGSAGAQIHHRPSLHHDAPFPPPSGH